MTASSQSRRKVLGFVFLGILTLTATTSTSAYAANGTVSVGKVVVSYTPTASETAATSVADIANARAMPLPQAYLRPVGKYDGGVETRSLGTPGYSPGSRGTGAMSPMEVPRQSAESGDEGVQPEEYGTSSHVYTTARVDESGNVSSSKFPYRAVGKLYFRDGTGTFVCSASVIKKGVVVTAAHCVARFGQSRFYTNFQFVPALSGTLAPYGTWTAAKAFVMTSYFNGTDSCATRGIVCANDIAVLRMNMISGVHVGQRTGILGYGWDGYGFNGGNLALISQLGYPSSHDSGVQMQRSDSEGFVSSSRSNNTIWGSRQTGGSSGGPEVVNLGIRGALTTSLGAEALTNIVVGVTSWGYTDAAVKQQGASPFKSTNIVPLVNAACAFAGTC